MKGSRSLVWRLLVALAFLIGWHGTVAATSLTLTGIGVPAGAAPASVSYRTMAADTGNNSTYTFSSQDIGTAAADRYVIVAVSNSSAGSGSLSSATIAGVSATILQASANGGGDIATTIIGASVPTGATGSVVVNFGTGQVRCAIGVWAVYGLLSTTPVATASQSGNPGTLNVNTHSGGIVVAAGVSSDAGSSATWSGATERYDATTELQAESGADYTASSAETPHALSITWTSQTFGGGSAAVSMR